MFKKLKIHFLAIILTITSAGTEVPAYSLSPRMNSGAACFFARYHWRNFTKQGKTIAGNYVRAILEHSNGDIWFATSGGLSQFNGLWTTYARADSGELPALELKDAIGLVEDSDDGSLWVATKNGVLRAQITRINEHHPFYVERWDTYNSSNGLNADTIFAIAKDARNPGIIWVGTDKGAFLFDGNNWTTRKDELLLENSVTAIYADSNRRLWFGIRELNGQTAVYRFDGQDWDVFTQLNGLPGGDIYAIAEDKAKNIWIATPNGVSRYDGSRWDTFTSADGLAHDETQAIMVTLDGCIWFGTSNGVSIVRETEVFDKQSWQKLTKSDGLVNDNNIRAICEDRNGGIWLGTNGKGVNFTDRIWQTFTTESGLPDNSITAIGEDGEHNIWVGTPNGLCKYNQDATDGCWDIFTDLIGRSIRSITAAPDGGLWIGTDEGLFHYDGIGLKRYTKKEDGLNSNSIHAIELDLAGNVWVGVGISETDWFGALHKSDVAGEDTGLPLRWKTYKTDTTVSSLLFDSSGMLWVGTFRDGIRVLMGEQLEGFTDGLMSNAISAIIEDANGNIWIGTANGISIWERTNSEQIGNFINLTTDWGLIDYNVQSLFMAGDGRIWVGTSDGISIAKFPINEGGLKGEFALEDISWDTRTYNDGLASNDIGVIFESNDGSIWMGSNDRKGLTRRQMERVAPRTRITKGKFGTIGENSVRFEFEGGDASTPTDKLTYTYQLEAGGDILQERGFNPQKYVDFFELEDKEYTFTVKAKDRDGNIDEIGAKAIFRVDAAPPEARIDEPYPNQVIGGTFDIKGTATDTDFLKYKIQAGPNFSYESDKAVEDNVLASWNTQGERDWKHSIILTVRDSKEHEKILDPVAIFVDNKKPKVRILKPQTGEPASSTVTITGEIVDEHPKSYTLKYSHDSSNWEEIVSNPLKDTIVEYLWDSSSVDGETILRLSAVDEAGNTSESEPIIITLNNKSARPRVEISKPREGQIVTGTVEIIGTATSHRPFEKFELKYKSQTSDPLGSSWILIKKGDFPIEEDNTIAFWDTAEVADGIYELKLFARDDTYDNFYPGDGGLPIKVDNSIPTANIISPEDGSIISNNTPISGDAFDDTFDDNFDKYLLEYAKLGAGEEWEKLFESSEPKHNELLAEWNTSGFSGEYRLKLTAWNKAGLESKKRTIEITLDNNPPTASISAPLDGDRVSGFVEIRGTAKDDNVLKNYRVFVKRESDSEARLKSGIQWSEIGYDTKPKEDSTLVVWDTRGKNGVYLIKLTVCDETDHCEDSLPRTVIVDNKAPISMIKAPANYQQVSGEVRLIGTAYDENFARYTIEYGEGANPKKWDTISEVAFLEKVQDELLAVWRIPDGKTGIHTLRLIVFDGVGHQSDESRVTVVISRIIPCSTGGEASDNNGKAKIIIPPNSLEKDTAITINPVNDLGRDFSYLCLGRVYTVAQDKPIGKVDIVCDFLPAIHLNRIKPATIIISYPEETVASPSVATGETLALFFLDGSVVQNIGGTVDKKEKTVAAPVTKLGRYALMRIKSEPKDNASIHFLTCQPRAFSPRKNEETRISFTLSQPTNITIKIYKFDLTGKLKRILKDNQIMHKGGNVLPWDGKDENGKIVPGGPYIVTVATDDNVVYKSVIVWR